MDKKMLIGTGNKGKIKEIREILGDTGLELVTPAELGLSLDIPETGDTYKANARIKAKAYAKASGMLSLADDSGLEVDALEGAPGIYSARFSPKAGASDADRRVYLLEQLAGKPQPWTARFRCVVVVIDPDGDEYIFEGVCEGEIVPEERGDGGFGYDPIFLVAGFGQTMAELSPAMKNGISHRGVAVRQVSSLGLNISD